MLPLTSHSRVNAFLPVLRSLSTHPECYLVGGAIRDWLLQRPSIDFDFATAFDPEDLSRAFARQLQGHWFFLDKVRRQTRVIADLGTERLTFDFAPFRAASLVEDLSLRDFTINAMAFALHDEWHEESLIDPCGGRNDLVARTLRATSETVLRSDPLRILKGVRHCLELELRPEPATLLRMRQTVPELRSVAVERIRQEMLRILFACAEPGLCDSLLQETGIGRFFWGEHFSSPGLSRVQQRANQFWKTLRSLSPGLEIHLQAPVEEGVNRQSLLHWFFLLELIYPGCALTTARSWRFSKVALRRLEALDHLDDEAWEGFRRIMPGKRPLQLWTAEVGLDPLDLLLAMAFVREANLTRTIKQILPSLGIVTSTDFGEKARDLVDGQELQSLCKLKGGTEVGRMLKQLRLAEAYGQIQNRSQAMAYARALCDEKD